MGRNLNPGNEGFTKVLNGRYVDKTGLISEFDSTLDTTKGLVLVSRPRRFGKSFAAKALSAFYSLGCDSRALFSNLEVARRDCWDQNLNKLNVIYLDMAKVMDVVGSKSVVEHLNKILLLQLSDQYPDAFAESVGRGDPLSDAMYSIVSHTGIRFVFVIDEWDAPYRLTASGSSIQDDYASWLRSLFKDNTFTPYAIAGAFMTGILPIKKYAHQSAVSDFREFTMIESGLYAPFVGFTSDEVQMLAQEYDLDIDQVRNWYDGYRLRYREKGGDGEPRRTIALDVFAPYSVMSACESGKVKSYWPSTEAYETILPYIEYDLDGLQEKTISLVSGTPVHINADAFRNDLVDVMSADEALTLLCHLGYLAFDDTTSEVFVPNEEVRAELGLAVSNSRNKELVRMMRQSKALMASIVSLDEDAVAEGMQAVHDRECTPLFYNNEQALRAVVKSALVSAIDDYARIEELPSGHGFADICYIPKVGKKVPAVLIELKWDKPAETAIDQIKKTGYWKGVSDLGCPLILVAITYESSTRERRHSCRIELWEGV